MLSLGQKALLVEASRASAAIRRKTKSQPETGSEPSGLSRDEAVRLLDGLVEIAANLQRDIEAVERLRKVDAVKARRRRGRVRELEDHVVALERQVQGLERQQVRAKEILDERRGRPS